jgi:hypothetical protein
VAVKFFAITLLFVWLAGLGPALAWAEADAQTGNAAAEEIASQVPDTDIFLMRINADGEPDLASLRNLTRRVGYDNQPAFLPAGATILFSAIGDDLQSDIYSLGLSDGSLKPVTQTPESEYSPTPMAGGGFSVVRVESDGTQHLWRYSAEGAPLEMLEPELGNVGYHHWLAKDRLALFLVEEPTELVLVRLDDRKAEPVATDIGRSFSRDPESGSLYFLRSAPEGAWQLCSRNETSGEIAVHITAPGNSQDMAIDKQGWIWMADGKTLWRWRPGQDHWSSVMDLNGRLPGGITRLAFSGDASELAMVVDMAGDQAE